RILVVDDESGIRMVCREALERMNHEVIECEDGLQALSKLQDSPFDLILMDLKMPNMDGAEMLAKLRSTDPRTPVLIMTGLIDEDMLASVPHDAFSGILKKPFQISELKSWIAKFSSALVN
ncbi:MAG: response regulator, partial [Candidatus Wallbacteria bacterium]|nr:response regulator [Candidatus Wallbacteria bacterium]